MAGAAPRPPVVPLVNISPDPGDEYFADGMTEELFDPGDAQNKEFWLRVRASAPELSNAFVMAED